MVKTKQQQQLDLADRIEKVQALIDEISREIDSIKAHSPIAPPACGIVRCSRTSNEYIKFLHIALGSLRELDTQLIIAKEVKLVAPELFDSILEEVDSMQGILVSTLQKLKS